MSPYMDAAWPWLLTITGGRRDSALGPLHPWRPGFAGFTFIPRRGGRWHGALARMELKSSPAGIGFPQPKLKGPAVSLISRRAAGLASE
jgi:hypothetical protein